MIVLEFPPKLSFNNQVKAESLYGMYKFRFRTVPEDDSELSKPISAAIYE